MGIPSEADAQNAVDQAKDDVKTAEKARDAANGDLAKAEGDAQKAKDQAAADRLKADDLNKKAETAKEKAKSGKPEDLKEANDAQKAANKAEKKAKDSETDKADKDLEVTRAKAAKGKADTDVTAANTAKAAAEGKLKAVKALDEAEKDKAAADAALKAEETNPQIAAAQQTEAQLNDMKARAEKAAQDAVAADKKVNGLLLSSTLDYSWKVDGLWNTLIHGDQWKTSGSELKGVLGHSSNVHLGPKFESVYGAKYTVVGGLEVKSVVGAALTTVAGAKWDTVIGSKSERVDGAKVETHAGTKTELANGPQTNKEPSFRFKYAKWFSDKTDAKWTSGDQTINSIVTEFKIRQEQDTIAEYTETLRSLIGQYEKMERKFSGDYKVEVKGGSVKAPTITINASTKLSVSSKGNILELSGGSAKLGHGTGTVECKPGQVLIRGNEVKAE
ncbi:MAG: hypothetical protein U1E76_10750 [Planctomycetota bacterium]